MLEPCLGYMAMFAEIEHDSLYESVLIFWEHFCKQYCRMVVSKNGRGNNEILKLGNSQEEEMKEYFSQFLLNVTKTRLINTLIDKMPKPQEVVFVLDENGLPKKLVFENTSHSEHYKRAKTILCTLAKTDFMGLSGIFKEHVSRMMGFIDFDKLNSLCWAIGTISGSASKNQEKGLLIKVLTNLLNMVEHHQKLQEKATIATNIMYVVGQYPEFLTSNEAFFFCVISKLFEFMTNTYDEVK